MSKLLGNLKKGLVFVVSAPAGTGKSTLIDMRYDEFPNAIERSVSCSTREPRGDESHGTHYHFISDEEFTQKVQEEAFLEWAEVFGAKYGTLKCEVDRICKSGKHAFLVIDTQGAAQLMTSLDAIYLFIKPPSMEELQKRLEGRGSESPETMLGRLSQAEKEIKKSSVYDYQICNDDLQLAYQVLRSIIIAEEHKNRGKLT